MKTKQDVEQEVERTLKLLEKRPQLQANPYLKTRLQQRIKAESYQGYGVLALKRKLLDYASPLLLGVLFCVNIYVGILFYQNTLQTKNSDLESMTVTEEMAQTYSISTYNYDNYLQ